MGPGGARAEHGTATALRPEHGGVSSAVDNGVFHERKGENNWDVVGISWGLTYLKWKLQWDINK